MAIFAEYQGENAVIGSTTGFQRSIDELIERIKSDGHVDATVYCMGTTGRTISDGAITIRQYSPNLSVRTAAPFVPTEVFPFMVDLLPFHPRMICDVVRERPDIIHTFQTFGATDFSALVAAKLLELIGRRPRLVNTVMTEIDSYFGAYVRAMAIHLLRQLDTKHLRGVLALSLTNDAPDTSVRPPFRCQTASRVFFTLFWSLVVMPFRCLQKEQVLVEGLSTCFRALLRRQIRFYLNRCDVVMVSRAEDETRYGSLKARVYFVPLACDFGRFRVFSPAQEDFAKSVSDVLGQGRLSNHAAEGLLAFASEIGISGKRPVIYVGRLSEEKNIEILVAACSHLLAREGLKAHVHLLFVGARAFERRVAEAFGQHASVTGLIPNCLLPWIYNFVRAQAGYFVSASDTETYGIAIAEASACGLPVVVMERGTRGHLFLPGDRVGGEILVQDAMIADATARIQASEVPAAYQVGLNGLLIPDYTDNREISAVAGCKKHVVEALASAMYLMSQLPGRVVQRMAEHSQRLSRRTGHGWSGLWNVIRTIYDADDDAYEQITRAKAHEWNR